ncbi:MAG: hypothetical protein K2X27_14500 [Candidatus Obscuribacterales bacterium]|nr:hypothetical protein [Candidatus Obscuribacterales bacterium]
MDNFETKSIVDGSHASSRESLMLVLEQAKGKINSKLELNSLAFGGLALGLSVAFGLLGAEYLHSGIAGFFLGTSLFAYSILLAGMFKRQPPLFIKRLFSRKDLLKSPRTINELSGLRLDYVAAKDPQDNIDGVVHNRAGELQRLIRCALPERHQLSANSLLLELLFADLASFEDARFQIVFPASDRASRKEMIVIASFLNVQKSGEEQDLMPPLLHLQEIVNRLLERLITLGIAPKIMNALEARQLISQELGSRASCNQLQRDWRSAGELGWEPSFRDLVLRPTERSMQVADRLALTMTLEQLPVRSGFEWLSAFLLDLPEAHLSIFLSPFNTAAPLSKLRLKQKLKKIAADSLDSFSEAAAAQMSFSIRFDGRDSYKLESELSTARKYLGSFGIKGSFTTQRQQQLQNWRATLPCAQAGTAVAKHLIAFRAKAQRVQAQS